MREHNREKLFAALRTWNEHRLHGETVDQCTRANDELVQEIELINASERELDRVDFAMELGRGILRVLVGRARR